MMKMTFVYTCLFVLLFGGLVFGQDTVIYCIGDSITLLASHNYPALLNRMFEAIGVENVRFYNKGVSGDTVGDRLDAWSNASGQRILDLMDVHYVTIMLGTNDTRVGDETPTNVYVERMNSLIDVFVNHTNQDGTTPQVLLSLIPPHNSPQEGEPMVSQFADAYIHRDRIPTELNPALEQIAEERGLMIIDCYTPMKAAGPEILIDGLHPGREGSQILADAFFAVFEPLLNPFSNVEETIYEAFQ